MGEKSFKNSEILNILKTLRIVKSIHGFHSESKIILLQLWRLAATRRKIIIFVFPALPYDRFHVLQRLLRLHNVQKYAMRSWRIVIIIRNPKKYLKSKRKGSSIVKTMSHFLKKINKNSVLFYFENIANNLLFYVHKYIIFLNDVFIFLFFLIRKPNKNFICSMILISVQKHEKPNLVSPFPAHVYKYCCIN